jgi:hypothetical protein
MDGRLALRMDGRLALRMDGRLALRMDGKLGDFDGPPEPPTHYGCVMITSRRVAVGV